MMYYTSCTNCSWRGLWTMWRKHCGELVNIPTLRYSWLVSQDLCFIQETIYMQASADHICSSHSTAANLLAIRRYSVLIFPTSSWRRYLLMVNWYMLLVWVNSVTIARISNEFSQTFDPKNQCRTAYQWNPF